MAYGAKLMGGNNTQRTRSQTNTNQTATQTNTGTPYAQTLLPNVTNLGNQVMNQTAFGGDRVTQAVAPTTGFVAQRGDLPTTFVPQATATQAPLQTNVTHVDRNAQEGIDAGLTAANQNRSILDGFIPAASNYWQDIVAGGGQNPHLQSVIDAFTQDFNERSATAQNQRAQQAGSVGAFGSTGYSQEQAWAAEQEQQAYNQTTAGLRYEDFLNTQGLIGQATGQMGNLMALNMQPAEQLATYGGMRQQNLSDAAAAGDENAQRALNNLWQAMSLNDSNAVASAQDEIARWEAAYAAEQARVAEGVAQAGFQTQNNQATLDNNWLRWLNSQELLNSQIGNMGSLIGATAQAPGGTTTSQGSQTTNSTTTQEQPLWQTLAGLGSAGMQMFAPGGWFSGSAAGAAGAGAGAAAGVGGAGSSLSSIFAALPFAFSDRRVKADIAATGETYKGIPVYQFRYLWDEPGTKRIGVMADETPVQFVKNIGGFSLVDYPSLAKWEN